MKKEFSTWVLSVMMILAGCTCTNTSNSGKASTSITLDSTAFQNIILRDSVVLLKYKTQRDTISFPVINPQFPELAKSLNPEIVLGERLSEIKENYENCGCGYTSLMYKESFSNAKILSLWFYAEFIGAYPSQATIYQTLSINTGLAYKLTQQLNEAGQKYVLIKYKDTLLKRLETDKTNHTEKDYVSAYNQIKENINQLTFDAINDNYIVKDSFIVVKTEPILPHAILACEIDRQMYFSLDELKKFKKNSASI
jgi:hypothetical protein